MRTIWLSHSALAVAACSIAFAAPASSAQDSEPREVDCSIQPKRAYSLKALKRTKAVSIPTRCDGATRVVVTFEVSAPLRVALNTPHQGVPDADGDAVFDGAGTKKVRVKLHRKTVRAIARARWVKGSFGLAVEIPDEPGYYYGVPEDRRKVTFRG